MKKSGNPRRRWPAYLTALGVIGAPALVGTGYAQTYDPFALALTDSIKAAGLGLSVLGKAFNKPVKVKRYTDPACKGDNPVCGAIVYANSGGYIVSSVSLNAKGGQPGGVTLHPSCAEVDVKLKANVKRNGYDTFVVPANCLYKLEINISGGPKKQRDVFLTPGCAAAPYTDGTVTENEWHVNVEWMKGVKPAGADDVPVDKEGNKCSVS